MVTIEELKSLYRDCFPLDSVSCVNLFFEKKLGTDNCYYKEEGGRVVCALYLVNKKFFYRGAKTVLPYIVGLGTASDARYQGHAKALLSQTFDHIYKDSPFVALYPFSHAFYERLGFATVSRDYILDGDKFEATKAQTEDIYDSFTDELDYYIIKDKEDYDWLFDVAKSDDTKVCLLTDNDSIIGFTDGETAIPTEYYRGDKNGSMIRVINPYLAFKLSKLTVKVTLNLHDTLIEKNNIRFNVIDGEVIPVDNVDCLDVDIEELSYALCGQPNAKLSPYFPSFNGHLSDKY